MCGMNFQNRGHPERSGGGKAGVAESKDPVEWKRDVHREAHGVLRLRFGRKAPFTPLRMTAIWEGHWQRSLAVREGGDTESKNPVASGASVQPYSSGFFDCVPIRIRPLGTRFRMTGRGSRLIPASPGWDYLPGQPRSDQKSGITSAHQVPLLPLQPWPDTTRCGSESMRPTPVDED